MERVSGLANQRRLRMPAGGKTNGAARINPDRNELNIPACPANSSTKAAAPLEDYMLAQL